MLELVILDLKNTVIQIIEMNEKKILSIEETFALAVQNHQKNNLQIAENLYKEILKTSPDQFESIFGLGTLFGQTKRFDLAKPLQKNIKDKS